MGMTLLDFEPNKGGNFALKESLFITRSINIIFFAKAEQIKIETSTAVWGLQKYEKI